MKLRIWLINQYAVPTSLPGITRHFELLNEWCNFQSLDITIWLSSFNYSLRRFLSKEEKNQISRSHGTFSINWGWAFPHTKNNWRRIVNMVSFSSLFFLKAFFSKKPDIIVASSPQIFVAYAALLIAKLFNKPFILEVRDLWPESLIAMNNGKQSWLTGILYKIERKLYKGAQHIIVLTQYQKDYIREKGVSSSKIDLVPNGILIDEQEEVTSETIRKVRSKMGVSSDAFIAIYTGAHGTANALSSVVTASKFLQSDEFIILIGDGPEKAKLLKMKRDNDLKQVIFLDPVPKTEIMNFTAAADCGIISLENNDVFKGARPNKLFDYMWLGKPILSTIGGEVGFILKNNEVGWVVARDVEINEGLAKLIKKAKNLSKAERVKIVENGRNYILAEGNRRSAAKKFLAIINEIASSRR
ncbi:glycosyltransferase family 4 protein [Parapedobacter sp.]